MIVMPSKKWKELDQKVRYDLLNFIREWCRANATYAYMHSFGVGIEETEESIITLMDQGLMKVLEREDGYRKLHCLAIYDPFMKKYIPMVKCL